MIRFDNLSKRYAGGFEALRNVSFEMDSGEMAFLTGHSGAGKSTLLKLLMLIERPMAKTSIV
jgi:cell division transport system ATP-binding protein